MWIIRCQYTQLCICTSIHLKCSFISPHNVFIQLVLAPWWMMYYLQNSMSLSYYFSFRPWDKISLYTLIFHFFCILRRLVLYMSYTRDAFFVDFVSDSRKYWATTSKHSSTVTEMFPPEKGGLATDPVCWNLWFNLWIPCLDGGILSGKDLTNKSIRSL